MHITLLIMKNKLKYEVRVVIWQENYLKGLMDSVMAELKFKLEFSEPYIFCCTAHCLRKSQVLFFPLQLEGHCVLGSQLWS